MIDEGRMVGRWEVRSLVGPIVVWTARQSGVLPLWGAWYTPARATVAPETTLSPVTGSDRGDPTSALLGGPRRRLGLHFFRVPGKAFGCLQLWPALSGGREPDNSRHSHRHQSAEGKHEPRTR